MKMSNTLSKILIFAAGVTAGSVVTWKVVKTKYDKLINEEVQSIRDLYEGFEEDECEEVDEDEVDWEDDSDVTEDPDEIDEYEKLIRGASYLGYLKQNLQEQKQEEENDMVEPYVIPPEEFDENGYETVSLYYYEDGVLAYMLGNEIVDNVDELVGEDSLTHFGEYEDDSVFVRNDRLKTDFEILKAGANYSEVD
jgi:hypothetical protein